MSSSDICRQAASLDTVGKVELFRHLERLLAGEGVVPERPAAQCPICALRNNYGAAAVLQKLLSGK